MAKRRLWRKAGVLAAELVLALLLYLGLKTYMQRDMAGGLAPSIEAPTLSGERVQLSAYQGKPVLIHFWATWCSICRLEQGGIDAISHDWPVLTVATQSGDAEEIRRYLHEQGLDWRVVVDEDGEWARRYGVKGVPANFILDPSGHVRFRESGYSSAWGLRARLWWASN